ncbi:unnamed protein product [Adineta steineri]|uniref:Carbohydrate sulfotransferase n=1 Tax=Adineta steineri TaxID=433720 RepID=A0A813QCU4_9BILA|nr:unnamed protein product [Adineta steineri]CAF1031072.1 unnamed protein product [Adineta steineri]
MNYCKHLFTRKKLFRYLSYLIGIIILISCSYNLGKQIREIPLHVQQSVSTNLISNGEISSLSLPIVSIYRNRSIDDKCASMKRPSRQSLSNIIRNDKMLNYLGYVLRSHSLFYCSVPKVATRTLLTFMTYLHIRDDLIPLITNYSSSNIFNFNTNSNFKKSSDMINADYFKRILYQSTNNISYKSINDPSILLNSFLSYIMVINKPNLSTIDLWSMYQNKALPLIRLRTLANPSIIFSSKFTRVMFVRHPLERLASAYTDKITPLTNPPFSLYDSLRRTICRKYAQFYLTDDQRMAYRKTKGLSKLKSEPCQKIIPTFEHFIEYLMSSSTFSDVHWQPYSKLCQVCLFKYNFIGKYETMEEDLMKLIEQLGLNRNDWNQKSYFKTGKTKENYKSLYSNLTNQTICKLKYIYKDDFKLFDYKVEDYLTSRKNIQCSLSYKQKLSKKRPNKEN